MNLTQLSDLAPGDRVQVWNPGPYATGTVLDAESDPGRVQVEWEWDHERPEQWATSWPQRSLLRKVDA